MNFLDLIASDANVSAAFRQAFSPQRNQLIRRDATHRNERQFAAEPHTPSAFAPMDAERRAEIRADEHADHLIDERAERIARGE